MNALDLCRHCGDTRGAHQHYRLGTDCALCDCPRFRRRWTLRNLRHVTVTRSAAKRFVGTMAVLVMVAVAGIALCSGQAWASPGQCVYSGFGGFCDGQYVDPATGIFEHCEWGGFIVYTRNCFLVRPVPVDVDPRGWVPA